MTPVINTEFKLKLNAKNNLYIDNEVIHVVILFCYKSERGRNLNVV